MNKISGNGPPTGQPPVSSNRNTRHSADDMLAERDVQSEGQQFSELLKKKPKDDDQQQHSTVAGIAEKEPKDRLSTLQTIKNATAQNSLINPSRAQLDSAKTVSDSNSAEQSGRAAGGDTDTSAKPVLANPLGEKADAEAKPVLANPLGEKVDADNTSVKRQQRELTGDTVAPSVSDSDKRKNDKTQGPNESSDPVTREQEPLNAAQLAALQDANRQIEPKSAEPIASSKAVTGRVSSQQRGSSVSLNHEEINEQVDTGTVSPVLPRQPNSGEKNNDNLKTAINSLSNQAAEQPIAAENPKQNPAKDSKQDTKKQDDAVSNTRPTGDQILQGMFGASVQNEQASSSQPITISDHISELADNLAQRILVSDRSVSTDSAVHIQLRDSVLSGSEITINRDQGQLTILFNVPDAAVGQQLNSHIDTLQRQLGDKMKEPVSIQINVSSQSSDSNSDGRSRNRRDLNTEWQSD